MKDIPLKKFGSKLMVASKSVNRIPEEYLTYAQNLRIYDGGIGPRRGKTLLTNSTLGTNNKGGFVMNDKLYQIANSKIYEINETTGVQTEIATLGYDALTDVLVYGKTIAVISSPGKDLKLFNGTTVATITTDPASFPSANSGILEYCRGYGFCTGGNILYISRPITLANPEYSYDFTGSGSQQITYDDNIVALKSTLGGIFVITEKKVEFIGANSLQNVAGAAAFISTPIGDGGNPVNNLSVVASGEKIFYLTKNLEIQTVNYIAGVDNPQIGDISSRPVISIRELLDTIDNDQPTAFGVFNENDGTIQFHCRTIGSPFNDTCIVYDIPNDTWNVDIGKNYNYVVKKGYKYYGFSDINSSIYEDDTGNSDGGIAMETLGITQNINQQTPYQKLYGGFNTAGILSPLTTLDFRARIDEEEVFEDSIVGNLQNIQGGIGGEAIGDEEVGGKYNPLKNQPFNIQADEGRICLCGDRIQIEFGSNSQIQDYLIDTLGIRMEPTGNINTNNRF